MLDDIDIEELLKNVEARFALQRLRRERPWAYDIIRVLWNVSLSCGMSMDRLTRHLWEMRNPSGLPMPERSTETVQSCLNRHTSQCFPLGWKARA
jgi:hypothetical protein